MKIFSLKNCDTCKKAIKWLEANDIAFDNHDVRSDGLDKASVTPLVDALGWERALNRRSTTWRGLSDADKSDIDNAKAVSLIVDNPTLMKRPVFVRDGGDVQAGFDNTVQEWLRG